MAKLFFSDIFLISRQSNPDVQEEGGAGQISSDGHPLEERSSEERLSGNIERLMRLQQDCVQRKRVHRLRRKVRLQLEQSSMLLGVRGF